MTGGLGVARVIVLLFGVTMMLAGLATIAFGGAAAFITGLWMLGIGIACIIGTLIERVRYRSDATDREGLPTGKAGGEPLGDPAGAALPAGATRSSSTPHRAIGCASGWTRRAANGGT